MPEPQGFDEDTYSPVHGAFIADPTGGATVDAEARTAIGAIIDVLRSAGLIQQD